MRCGRDLFVIRSVVTNELGIEWVRRHLGPEFRVHEIKTRCSTPLHIDTTFVPLAPGKVLVNPDWINVAELPECLKKWEVLQAPRPTYEADSPMANPQFIEPVAVDERALARPGARARGRAADKLIRKLEESGLQPHPDPLRPVRPLRRLVPLRDARRAAAGEAGVVLLNEYLLIIPVNFHDLTPQPFQPVLFHEVLEVDRGRMPNVEFVRPSCLTLVADEEFSV